MVPGPQGQSVVPETHGQSVVPGSHGQSVVPEPHGKAMVPGPTRGDPQGQSVCFSMAYLHKQLQWFYVEPHGVPMVPVQIDKISIKERDRQRTITVLTLQVLKSYKSAKRWMGTIKLNKNWKQNNHTAISV